MVAQVTTALQVNATSGDGYQLVLPETRFVTFRVQGDGKVTAGEVTIRPLQRPPAFTPLCEPARTSSPVPVRLLTRPLTFIACTTVGGRRSHSTFLGPSGHAIKLEKGATSGNNRVED
jgi:hypothetical protein